MNNNDLFQESKKIVKNAGQKLLDRKTKKFGVVRKGKFDFITELDLMVQNYIIDEINNISTIPIISEEQKGNEKKNINYNNCFILDPIDGTHNLIAGLDIFGISLAFVFESKIKFGIIYFPALEKLYTGFIDQGSYNNFGRIKVSINDQINKSIIAYDNNFSEKPEIINNFIKLNENIFTIRISGSAAYDCCQIAEGNIDARVLNNTKICDIGAGKIIVEEAGGKMTNFDDKPIEFNNVKDIVVSSNKFHDQILGLFK